MGPRGERAKFTPNGPSADSRAGVFERAVSALYVCLLGRYWTIKVLCLKLLRIRKFFEVSDKNSQFLLSAFLDDPCSKISVGS